MTRPPPFFATHARRRGSACTGLPPRGLSFLVAPPLHRPAQPSRAPSFHPPPLLLPLLCPTPLSQTMIRRPQRPPHTNAFDDRRAAFDFSPLSPFLCCPPPFASCALFLWRSQRAQRTHRMPSVCCLPSRALEPLRPPEAAGAALRQCAASTVPLVGDRSPRQKQRRWLCPSLSLGPGPPPAAGGGRAMVSSPRFDDIHSNTRDRSKRYIIQQHRARPATKRCGGPATRPAPPWPCC